MGGRVDYLVSEDKAMTGRELQTLEHIRRNGNLVYMDGTGLEAERHFKFLLAGGYIESVPGKDWRLTEKGQNELAR